VARLNGSATIQPARYSPIFWRWVPLSVLPVNLQTGPGTRFGQKLRSQSSVRQLMALASLPVAIVRMTFHLLQSQANPVLLGLFEYFERQWMTSTAPALWNVHGNDVWRTNNHCEGWHSWFNRAISKHHPNIWLFLRAIQQEQAATELLHQQLTAGRPGHRTKKAYRSLEKRLATLKGRYDWTNVCHWVHYRRQS